MSASPQTQVDPSASSTQTIRWGLASRIAFRFFFLYFGLYSLLTQIIVGLLPLPGVEIPEPGTLLPFRQMVIWTADRVFRYKQALVYQGSGSGDKVFDWVQVFCLLGIAFAGTCIWSVLDRQRADYDKLSKWFRVFLRFALAGQLFLYGLVKAIPMQMPFPQLTTLLERFGDFSPMGVLWSSVGASPGYERFVGCAELLAGMLLVIPGTTMLGALICLIDMTEVFVLNMTYDIPVKLFAFHLMLIAAFLLIRDRSRLVQFCFRDCAVQQPGTRKFFAGQRANRIAVGAQLVFGLLLFAGELSNGIQGWSKYGGGAPKPPLYGIWNVDEMTIDGAVRAPLLTDYDRWRRIVFEYPDTMAFERMDDSLGWFRASLNTKTDSLVLKKRADTKWRGQLTIHHQDSTRMNLEGQLGQQKIQMRLSLVDRNKFLLIRRGFHWIQDYPFNR